LFVSLVTYFSFLKLPLFYYFLHCFVIKFLNNIFLTNLTNQYKQPKIIRNHMMN